MDLAIGLVFIVLIVSAPWIARKWGDKGSLAWGIITIMFLVIVLLMLR